MSSLRSVGELKKIQQTKSTRHTKKIKFSIRKRKLGNKFNRIVNKKKSRRENFTNNIDESDAEKTSINPQLNAYCLAKIFSYISPIERLDLKKVCKKWRDAVQMTWHDVKKLDAENLPVTINKKSLVLRQLLKNCCKYLTHFKSNLQYFWMSDILEKNCKNIVEFDVDLCSEYAYSFFKIIESMSKLKCAKVAVDNKLTCYNLVIRLGKIIPAEIEELHFLQRNDFDNELPVTAPALDKLTNLRCLTLQNYRLIPSTFKSILLNKNTLTYLDLKDCEFVEKYPKIFTELVKLEHLNLDKVDDINDNMIIEIAHNCPELKYFVHKREPTPVIPHNIFRELKYLKNLEHLVFPPVEKFDDDDDDDNLMADVADNCKKLKHLNVGKGENFSILDIEKITKLNNLEYLDIYWADVDSESMINFTSNCLELKELKIDFEGLSETDIEKLTNLKKLEKLNFSDCNDITDGLLLKFSINCTNLVELDLSGYRNVTEACLIQFGKLKYLKKLVINYIPQVPNAMFDYFHELEKFSCVNCPSVTDEGIIKVINNCQKLCELNLLGTGITIDTIFHAQKRQIRCKILKMTVDERVFREYFNLRVKSSSYPRCYLEINENRF